MSTRASPPFTLCFLDSQVIGGRLGSITNLKVITMIIMFREVKKYKISESIN